LAPRPLDPATLTREAAALMTQGRLEEAEALFARVLAAHPRHPVALWNLGLLLLERERAAEALALADRALAREPRPPQAKLLRGDALQALGRFDEAVTAYDGVAGDLAASALAKRGLALAAQQDHAGALAAFDRAMALKPDDPYPPYRRGIVRLQTGDYGGWADYEARWRLAPFLAKSGGVVSPQVAPRLTLSPTADDLRDRRILLLGEQGIGDQVMFASMIPDLCRLARSVALVCEPRLVRLFATSFPGIAVAGPADARVGPKDVDRLVAMGSLGGLFRGRAADIPGTPYLAPRPAVVERWAERLGPRRQPLRIGLSWRGGLPTTRRAERSIPLADLAPILDEPGCEFVSLQYGDTDAELAEVNAGRAAPVRAFPRQDIDDFEELAGLVANLDLVVTVQTALVHLTGGLGKPCLTLVPHNAEWRYGARGSAMPWYRSVRLFRQATPGDWAPVVAEAAEAVRNWA
jgi:tetratricopeptide (TPR) repeat protein